MWRGDGERQRQQSPDVSHAKSPSGFLPGGLCVLAHAMHCVQVRMSENVCLGFALKFSETWDFWICCPQAPRGWAMPHSHVPRCPPTHAPHRLGWEWSSPRAAISGRSHESLLLHLLGPPAQASPSPSPLGTLPLSSTAPHLPGALEGPHSRLPRLFMW